MWRAGSQHFPSTGHSRWVTVLVLGYFSGNKPLLWLPLPELWVCFCPVQLLMSSVKSKLSSALFRLLSSFYSVGSIRAVMICWGQMKRFQQHPTGSNLLSKVIFPHWHNSLCWLAAVEHKRGTAAEGWNMRCSSMQKKKGVNPASSLTPSHTQHGAKFGELR